jgi:uncharacterized membrane protein
MVHSSPAQDEDQEVRLAEWMSKLFLAMLAVGVAILIALAVWLIAL